MLYDQYKRDFYSDNYKSFFDQHKDSEWFKEKYDPTVILQTYPQKLEACKNEFLAFKEEFQKGNVKVSFKADDNEEWVPYAIKFTDGTSQGQKSTDRDSSSRLGEGLKEESSVDTELKNDNSELKKDDEEDKSEHNTHPPLDNNDQASKKSGMDVQEETPAESSKEEGMVQESQDGEEIDSPTLFIKTIPPQCTRNELMNTLTGIESGNVVKLQLSEPNPSKNFHRIGWVTYSSIEAAKEALQKLSGSKLDSFELNLIIHKEKPGERKAKITPALASQTERIQHDLIQARKLVALLDKEKDIENDIFTDENLKDYSEEQTLDLMIYYLRKVHFYCYYSAEEFSSWDNLVLKCGEIYLRGTPKYTPHFDPDTWAQNLDAKVTWRLENSMSLDDLTGKTLSTRMERDICEKHTKRRDEKVWECLICKKKFCGQNFVEKHIITRHEELWTGFQEEVTNLQFFLNYVNDPKRLTPGQGNQGLNPLGKHKRGHYERSGSKRGGAKKRGGSWFGGRPPRYIDLDETPKETMEIDYSFQLSKFRERRKKEKASSDDVQENAPQ